MIVMPRLEIVSSIDQDVIHETLPEAGYRYYFEGARSGAHDDVTTDEIVIHSTDDEKTRDIEKLLRKMLEKHGIPGGFLEKAPFDFPIQWVKSGGREASGEKFSSR